MDDSIHQLAQISAIEDLGDYLNTQLNPESSNDWKGFELDYAEDDKRLLGLQDNLASTTGGNFGSQNLNHSMQFLNDTSFPGESAEKPFVSIPFS